MTSTTSLVASAEPTEPVALIKTDVLGRMHRTPEQRKKILQEYERSGLSGPKFAALCGVKYQTFASWLQCRKRPRNAYLSLLSSTQCSLVALYGEFGLNVSSCAPWRPLSTAARSAG